MIRRGLLSCLLGLCVPWPLAVQAQPRTRNDVLLSKAWFDSFASRFSRSVGAAPGCDLTVPARAARPAAANSPGRDARTGSFVDAWAAAGLPDLRQVTLVYVATSMVRAQARRRWCATAIEISDGWLARTEQLVRAKAAAGTSPRCFDLYRARVMSEQGQSPPHAVTGLAEFADQAAECRLAVSVKPWERDRRTEVAMLEASLLWAIASQLQANAEKPHDAAPLSPLSAQIRCRPAAMLLDAFGLAPADAVDHLP